MRMVSISLKSAGKYFWSILFSLGIIAGSITYVSFLPEQGEAQSAMLPYGGMVTAAIYCCNGIEFIVGPPVGGRYFYGYDASVYREYQVFDGHGQWMNGTYIPAAGFCLYPEAECEGGDTMDRIFMVGTSM